MRGLAGAAKPWEEPHPEPNSGPGLKEGLALGVRDAVGAPGGRVRPLLCRVRHPLVAGGSTQEGPETLTPQLTSFSREGVCGRTVVSRVLRGRWCRERGSGGETQTCPSPCDLGGRPSPLIREEV